MQKKGFTLIEIMVAVAIIAFISSIAWSSYASAVAKSKWSQAGPCLSEVVLRLENFRSNHGAYPTTSDPWDELNLTGDCSESEHYMGNISVTNGGQNYIVAFWDVKRSVTPSTGNDIWAQTDVNGAHIHVNNTVDNIAIGLPAGYVLPTIPSP